MRLAEIEDEYRTLAAANRDAIFKHWRSTKRILGVISASLMVLGVISLILLLQSTDRSTEIQNNRLSLIRAQCVDQNQHHDDAIAFLHSVETHARISHSPQVELALWLAALTRLTARSPAAKIDPVDARNEILHLHAYQHSAAAQAKVQASETIAFIDTLARRRNCDAVVNAARLGQ